MITNPIALIDASTVLGSLELLDIAKSLRAYAKLFAPHWGTCGSIEVFTRDVPPGRWALIFADNPDVADALGYHTLTSGNQPMGKVFCRSHEPDTIQWRAGKPLTTTQIATTASHELVELIANPFVNRTATFGKIQYAKEPADPTQAQTFLVHDLPMSNFVFPSWFEPAGKAPYDYLGRLKRPLEIARGGYCPVKRMGKWDVVFGKGTTPAARAKFKREIKARLHPRTYRRVYG